MVFHSSSFIQFHTLKITQDTSNKHWDRFLSHAGHLPRALSFRSKRAFRKISMAFEACCCATSKNSNFNLRDVISMGTKNNKQKNENIYIYVSFLGEKHTHTSSLSKNANHCKYITKKCRDGDSSCLSSTHLLPSMLQLLFWSCHGTM